MSRSRSDSLPPNSDKARQSAQLDQHIETLYNQFIVDWKNASDDERHELLRALLAEIHDDIWSLIKIRSTKTTSVGSIYGRTCEKLLRNFHPDRYNDGGHFVATLKKIVKQQICNSRKFNMNIRGKKKPIVHQSLNDDKNKNKLGEIADDILRIIDKLIQDEQIMLVQEILAYDSNQPKDSDWPTLTAEELDVLRRRYNEGYTYEEIADQMKLTVDQVRYRHNRAFAKLKQYFYRKIGDHAE